MIRSPADEANREALPRGTATWAEQASLDTFGPSPYLWKHATGCDDDTLNDLDLILYLAAVEQKRRYLVIVWREAESRFRDEHRDYRR
jgi:hypothetical protein